MISTRHSSNYTPSDIPKLLNGHMVTQLIASAVRFGIPDHLAGRTLSLNDLSEATGIQPRILRRFLNALKALGLVDSTDSDHYRETPLSMALQCDTGELFGHAVMTGAEYYHAWADLDHSLLSGMSAFENRFQHSLWDRFEADEALATAFARTMQWKTGRNALQAVLEFCDFRKTKIVADLGAGPGTLTAGILDSHSHLRAIVMEQPSMIDAARSELAKRKLDNRCDFVSGSFLESIPSGADLYMLKSVIHNWSEDNALRILENCRSVMRSGARLLVVERARDVSDTLESAIRDLNMLVLFGSQDRTADEYAQLLIRAGFAVVRTAHSPSGFCLLEATPEH